MHLWFGNLNGREWAMRVDAKKAARVLVFWWVIAEVAVYYGSSRLASMNWNYYTPLHGMVVGLVVGLTLMKFTGLNFGQALLIGLGWAGGQYAASYALNFLTNGLYAVNGFVPFNLSNLVSQGMGIAPINGFFIGFFAGGIGGLVTAMILRRASLLGEGKGLNLTLGWAFAWGIGYLLDQLLFNYLYQSSIFQNNMLVGILVFIAVIGLLISTIGGRVMFKSIQDS
jgi:hypothetical protein